MTERLLTKAELALAMNMSVRSIDNYRQRGLPTHWVANGVQALPRFMLSEVKAWLSREQKRILKAAQEGE